MRTSIFIIVLALSLGLAGPAEAGGNDKKKDLPPGLEKKQAEGKPLPPGWQKKLAVGEILDLEIYRHGTVVAHDGKLGRVTVRVEGKLIRLIEDTREIVEILDL